MKGQHFQFCIMTLVMLGLAAGCGSRAMTPPRSEILAEAQRRGVRVPSVEEDEAAFQEFENLQKERLLALVRKRSTAGYSDPDYRLGVGDEIEINVFDVPELNVTAKVRQSGYLSLPLIGALKSIGLTDSELQEELTRRLSSFVRRPQVSVAISGYGSQKVAVIGAVYKPGNYSLSKGANSLLELLSEAGGVTDKAGTFVTFVPAEATGLDSARGPEARAMLSLASQKSDRLEDVGIDLALGEVLGTRGGLPIEIPVRGGDMLIVPEAGKVVVEGEVQKPGPFDVSRELTLLNALATAGGILYTAKIDEVEIVRTLPSGRKVHILRDLSAMARGEVDDVPLRNGDLVRVPSDPGRRLSRDTFESIQGILNFGIGGSFNVVP